MEKINIAELLKDCPKGIELNCTMLDKVILDGVDNSNDPVFPIRVRRKDGCLILLTKYGQYFDDDYAKCVIFPKGKTSWEGFHRPFEDGDVVCYSDCIAIFKEWGDETLFRTYVTAYLHGDSTIDVAIPLFGKSIRREARLATEEEKAKLFQAIKDNGYRWNPETKTLEKLIKPKFKVGDRIRHKCPEFRGERIIANCNDTGYFTTINDWISIKHQDDWELVPDKFDITSLKTFDQVLVRDFDNTPWEIEFFSRLLDGKHFKCSGLSYMQCIPYKGNEHLNGKKDDCNKYFKTWE